MSDDPRIGSPGTYEFSAPDGVLRITWLGVGPEAVEKAREEAAKVEEEADGEYLVTQIRCRSGSGWDVVPRFREDEPA